MVTINSKNVKRLNGKKLSTIIEKYHFDIFNFLDDDNEEMSNKTYNLLKNNKVSLEVLNNDPNFDFILTVDKYDAYCVYDY